MDFNNFQHSPFGDLQNNEILKALSNYKGNKKDITKKYIQGIYSKEEYLKYMAEFDKRANN